MEVDPDASSPWRMRSTVSSNEVILDYDTSKYKDYLGYYKSMLVIGQLELYNFITYF